MLCVCFFYLSFLEFSPIYESINFDAAAASAIFVGASAKKVQPVNPLERQNAFDSIDGVDNEVRRNPSKKRDVRNFLERCIPPPPGTSPPHDTDSDADDPVQISHRTLEKLNSLYSLYKLRQSAANEPTIEATDNVVFRSPQFDKCSSRHFRGSSKAMCSFVSVNLRKKQHLFSMCFLYYRTPHTHQWHSFSIRFYWWFFPFFYFAEC